MAMAGARAARSSWASVEGMPGPLGATWVFEEEAWNFAVYSEHGERVTLLLYREEDVLSPIVRLELDYLRHNSGSVWHCRIAVVAMKGARFYAYQVEGLYARAVHCPQGFDRQAAGKPGSNAGRAPLGLIAADREPFGDRRLWYEADAVIYKLHVGRFTAHPSSGVAGDRRGTFAGLIDKIPYLIELGVTVVELMPVFQLDPGENNYWGCNSISFFGPHSGCSYRCAVCDQHTEFRELVRALHGAGLEVILDVVYNHTGEGDHQGPILLRAGDEFLQTQGSNNNPYNQDNETSWLDWRRLDTHRDAVRFTRLMIAFRRAHPYRSVLGGARVRSSGRRAGRMAPGRGHRA